MLAVLLACVAMGLQDAQSTFLVVAEARGRALLAAVLDAIGDPIRLWLTSIGAGVVIKYGWTPHAIAIVTAITATSFFGTLIWTRLGRRMRGEDNTTARIKAVEERLSSLEASR